MHTQRTILLIVAGILAAVAAVVATLALTFGWAGVAAAAIGVLALVLLGRWVVGPWHRRWGATGAEVAAALPGDDLLAGPSAGSTRAVTIDAGSAAVWPWLVQLGFGRAGWYSYDWIDNDGRPSARAVVPEWQDLAVGDRILMMPDLGFEVRAIEPERSIVSQAPDGTTWCLALVEREGHTRLLSRFRVPRATGLGPRLWMLLAGPGSFVMERRMLLGIRDRAGSEREVAAR